MEITNEAVFIQSPTRFESLVIPSAGHILPDFFAPYYFDSLAVVQPKPIVPGKKLYVSRSDMTLSGGFTNERAIEQYLQTHGWTVFRLHEHPVSARFDELSSAEVILSIEGAGFLSFLFFQNIIHSKIFSLARNDNKRFNNDMMFNDIFETISKAKSLKHARLDIPKTYKTGSGFNSRFELDINVFRDLMKNTDFLSHESDDLQRFITRIDNIDDNAAQSRQLITTIQDILTTDCPPERVHCYKSGLFESQGNLDTAIAELKKSIAIQSNNSQTHARLARLLMEKGDFHQAVVAQKTAMALDEEDHPHFHIKLSHLYVQIHELDQAIAEAQTAIRMDESNPYLFQLYHHLGAVLLQKPDWTGAEKALDKAIALNSTFPDAHFLLSHIYAHNGKLNDAVEKAQTATQLRDDQPDFHHHLGNLLMHMRQWDAAEGAHAKALELKPDFLAAKQQLAVIRTRKSQSKH